jgi:FkbM family methyltransferase
VITSACTHAFELIRCARHNLLHLKTFGVSYRRGVWRVREGEVQMVFPYYPYLAFHDIEGYTREGSWKPEKGMTVLDVGGCDGEFALYASKRVGPSGRVLMLEPDARNIAVARRVFELNGNPANIQIIPCGLWSRPGKVRFSAGQGPESTVVSGESSSNSGDTVEIETHSLSSLVEQYKLDRLDFVKMDIEGAELEAMSTASELPAHLKPRYAIASYHVVDGKETADALVEVFARLGYHCKTGNPRHLTTWASPTPF